MTLLIETSDEGGHSHWVNPARLLWITEFSVNSDECRLVFGEHDYLDIAESAESFNAKLRAASPSPEKNGQ